jgi:hypothetical protein
MDSYEKKSYGSEPEYGMDSYEKKSYGSEPEYGTDSYDKRSYGSDDYKSQYSSYGKDDRDKSKDSVSIKKVKCNNINLNLNGLNITAAGGSGNGDNGGSTDDSAVGAASLLGNGNGNSNGYGDKNNKFVDKKDGFTFVCINNNNNNFTGGGVTPPTPVETCEDCFNDFALTEDLLTAIVDIDIGDATTIVDILDLDISATALLALLTGIGDVGELCDFLIDLDLQLSVAQILALINFIFDDITPEEQFQVAQLFICLINIGVIDLTVGTTDNLLAATTP